MPRLQTRTRRTTRPVLKWVLWGVVILVVLGVAVGTLIRTGLWRRIAASQQYTPVTEADIVVGAKLYWLDKGGHVTGPQEITSVGRIDEIYGWPGIPDGTAVKTYCVAGSEDDILASPALFYPPRDAKKRRVVRRSECKAWRK